MAFFSTKSSVFLSLHQRIPSRDLSDSFPTMFSFWDFGSENPVLVLRELNCMNPLKISRGTTIIRGVMNGSPHRRQVNIA